MRSNVLLSLWALAVLGCGGGGGDGGDPLPPDLLTRYAEVEQCTGLSAPAPEIRFVAAVACPSSGKPCCLETIAPFPCFFDPSVLCGAGAAYDDGVITAHPDDIATCGDPIRFEMVRHVLCRNGIGNACETETDFSDPRWSCQ